MKKSYLKVLTIVLVCALFFALTVGCGTTVANDAEVADDVVDTVEEAPEAPAMPEGAEGLPPAPEGAQGPPPQGAEGPPPAPPEGVEAPMMAEVLVNGEPGNPYAYPAGGVTDIMMSAEALGAVALFGEEVAYENINAFACDGKGSYVVKIDGVSEGDKVAVMYKIAGPGNPTSKLESVVNADGGIEFEGEAGEYVILKAS